MKKEYDFSRARRGAVLPAGSGKTRITIRIDDEILKWFRRQVNEAGGGNYQTLLNAALREYIEAKRESLESTLRRVLREELPVSEAYRIAPKRKPSTSAAARREKSPSQKRRPSGSSGA